MSRTRHKHNSSLILSLKNYPKKHLAPWLLPLAIPSWEGLGVGYASCLLPSTDQQRSKIRLLYPDIPLILLQR